MSARHSGQSSELRPAVPDNKMRHWCLRAVVVPWQATDTFRNCDGHTFYHLLPLLSTMSASDWAAWVQAIGTIVAIFGAVGIAMWQTEKQHKSALAEMREDRRQNRREAARNLLALADEALDLLHRSGQALPKWEAIMSLAQGDKHLFDVQELQVMEGALDAVQLHVLPHDLVRPARMVQAGVRRYRMALGHAIERHREMDAAQSDSALAFLGLLTKKLEKTCHDIDELVRRDDA